MKQKRIDSSGYSTERKQNFIDIPLKILSCRYWYIDLWDGYDMAFPFWALFYNVNEGGVLYFNGNSFKMVEDKLYIISPFTSYSTKYLNKTQYESGIWVSGANITTEHSEDELMDNHLLHFFVHFNLGAPFDHVLPGIYEIEVTDSLKRKLQYLMHRLKIESSDFKITFNLKLQSFIKEAIAKTGPQLWKTINIDSRVLEAHRYIEKNIHKKLRNEELASLVYMAPNSFARLFKQEMNLTLYQFIQKRKIARACDLFEHSNGTIESIAFELGFADRYHFSRVFKAVTGLSPGSYKNANRTK